ncbi:GGDEF domain-containing protein [Neptuniibacter sp. PT8_73]|uniref:GGDEF domain-containing protein n=1 Tax=Neptuniibacter sp. PT8_73 TaxID=3398206 RepID=UPI0039F45FC0
MRPITDLKSTLFNSLYRAALISCLFAAMIVFALIFLSIEKDLRQEGQYLGQLVFKDLRQAMNQGTSYEEVNRLIDSINEDAPDITYSMYRGAAVQKQFGGDRAITKEISQLLGSKQDATQIESLDKIHYYHAFRFKQECLACHTEAKLGDIAGVLDVTFPAHRVRLPVSEVLMGLFLVFSITVISSYLFISRDLFAHIVQPLKRLESKLRDTEGHHNLNEKLALDSELEEINSIEHSFNSQQALLQTAFQQVEELSIYDKLTGTYSRHQLERLLDEERSRADRQNRPLTISMIDMNGFKQINDVFGHHAGDCILIHFCQILSENLRTTDKVIRYGGDEFIILLPDSSQDVASELIQRIEEIAHSSPYHYKGQGIIAKFSYGSVEYPSESDTDEAKDLLQIADERMYSDKQRRKQK